uniref:Metallothionein-like protein n=1 Tax=Kalanchoe fedtschenkoi TaxID=63787 RepID=A0A7N1A1E7_KALFE
MSCCGGNCGCGSSCKCGNGCGGCGMYPDIISEKASVQTRIIESVTASVKMFHDEIGAEGSENGCKCGSSCTCDPCSCK